MTGATEGLLGADAAGDVLGTLFVEMGGDLAGEVTVGTAALEDTAPMHREPAHSAPSPVT